MIAFLTGWVGWSWWVGGDPAMNGAADGTGFVLPTGTVAFLLTDVEASTRLWGPSPDAMAKAMDRHNEIIDAAVSASGWGAAGRSG